MLNRLKRVLRDIRVTGGAVRIERPADFVPLVLRRLRTHSVLQRHEWHSPIVVRLRVETPLLTLAMPASESARPITAAPVHLTRRREEIIERVKRREVRIETGVAMAFAPASVSAPVVASPSRVTPPMVLRAAPPAPAVTAVAPAAEVFTPTPRMQPRAAPFDVNAIDINRLTDQVVSAIDRRVNARRERSGRV
jgi:hypothetical protein